MDWYYGRLKPRRKSILDRIDVNCCGEPDDFKGPVVFLGSPASNYVNGILLCCRGMGR